MSAACRRVRCARGQRPGSSLGAPPAGSGAGLGAAGHGGLRRSVRCRRCPSRKPSAACIGAAVDETEVRRLVDHPALAPHLELHPEGHLVLAGATSWWPAARTAPSRPPPCWTGTGVTLRMLATLPFVRMLAFSGGTAHQNPGAKADIDLFVIAAARTRLHRLRAAVRRHQADPHPRHRLPQLPDRRERAGHRLPPRRVHRPPAGLGPPHQRARHVPGFLAGQPGHGCSRCSPASSRGRAVGVGAGVGADPVGQPKVQRLAELALAPLAAPLERLLRWGWRLHLRQRAARARRPDVVLSDGILKLHMSDYRRRVLERFAGRLAELRASVERTGASRTTASTRAVGP